MSGLIASEVLGKTRVALQRKQRQSDMPSKSSEAKKGGLRNGAGAKPLYDKAMRRFQVMLDASTADKLKALGDGNLSAGIREAAKRARIKK